MAARLRRSAVRFSVVLALALATLVAAAPAHSADTSYLKEMPSPERVLREIKGSDARDTVARQAAAVTWLIRMMNARIGRVDANLNRDSISAPERELMEAYYAAAASVLTPTESTLNTRDLAYFRAQVASYQESADLKAEIEKKFFSAQWLAEHRVIEQRLSEAARAKFERDYAAQRAQEEQAPSVSSGPGAGDFAIAVFKNNIGYLVFGGLVALWAVRRGKRKHALAVAHAAAQKE
jgi:hypothetical protein